MKKLLLHCCFLLAVPVVAQVAFTESTLPVLVVNTNGQAIPDEPKITAELGIIWNGPGQLNRLDDPFNEYAGRIGIERRGSTSQLLFPKHSFSIELRDFTGEDRPEPLFGFPKESDWVLVSLYNDKSLIRDALAYTLAGRVMTYAPRCLFVELVLNGNYEGVYLFTERIKRDPNRVTVSKNKPDEDLTGGYILKLDKEAGDSVVGLWYSHVAPLHTPASSTIRFFYHYPRTEDLTPAQKQYIHQWMYDFEENLRAPNFADPALGYRNYLDPATFIDYMWINEAVKNIDAYRISTFFYKDKDAVDGRLKMGPVWDFNLAFGNCNYCTAGETQGWMWDFNKICPDDYWVMPFWWERLRQDTNFLIQARERWRALRAGPLSDYAVRNTIDSLSGVLAGGPRNRNFERWPVLGVWLWPNNFVGNTYEEELSYLKNWTSQRLQWMDQNAEKLYGYIYEPDGYFPPRLRPNPARGKTRLEFYAPIGARLSCDLYDSRGQLIDRWYTVTKRANYHAVDIDLPESPGVYLLRVELGSRRFGLKVAVF